MAKKIKDIDLIQMLISLNKPYFAIEDFEKILSVKKESLYVTLNRLVKSGVLVRLKSGIYQPVFKSPEIEKTANDLYYPSYLSFESALSRYGIISQTPYSTTFATTNPTRKISLADREVEYRQIKKELFFGYGLVDGLYISEPEKAVLDELYFIGKGLAASDLGEWSLLNMDEDKLSGYAMKFPEFVRLALEKLLSNKETAEIASVPGMLKSVSQAETEIKQEKHTTLEELKKKHGLDR